MGEAFFLAEQERVEEQARILTFRQQLWQSIKQLPKIQLNAMNYSALLVILISALRVLDGDSLLLALHRLAISHSSACTSASIQPSYVLMRIRFKH